MRFRRYLIFVLLAFSFAAAQEVKKAALVVACEDEKPAYTSTETVSLRVTIENRGTSIFYVYRPLEWGWTGLWFHLLDAAGKPVTLRETIVAPLPPPPVGDKSQLIGLDPGYFYGRRIQFALSDYDLKPGTYFIAFTYQSYYRERDGFGLPILTWDDGEMVANQKKISVR